MQFNSSCKAIETWVEGFFRFLVQSDMAEVMKDGYNPQIENSVYTRVYRVYTLPDNVKVTFRYDHRVSKDAPAGAGYVEVSNDGLQLIFQQLSFYTILKAAGISLFDSEGFFDKNSLKTISDKVFDATGQRIEIRLIE